MKLAVLIASHNRRDATLGCMSRLLPQLGEEARVYLVDDGSTDGTAVAVAGLKDKRIKVIYGDGRLYWAKGMELAWKTCLQHEVEKVGGGGQRRYDGFLWLNDDVELNAEALSKLELEVGVGDRVVVGELINARGEVTYGIRGDLFTGNFVYVPRSVYEKLGMICGDYHHAWADSDYAMRAKRAGVRVVSCGIVGKCEWHPNRPPLKGLSLKRRMELLYHPKGWNLHDLWLYRRRNWGVLAALVSCVHLVCHVMRGEG